jgi:hypothetical protein
VPKAAKSGIFEQKIIISTFFIKGIFSNKSAKSGIFEQKIIINTFISTKRYTFKQGVSKSGKKVVFWKK